MALRRNRGILLILCLLFSYIGLTQCPGTNLCSMCSIDLTVTEFDGGTILNSTSTIDGTVLAGGTAEGSNIQVQVDGCGEITMTVELDFIWERGSGINWIHGVSFQASDGWSAAEVVLPTNDWIFQETLTGKCFNNSFGQGYYYDPLGESCAGGDNSKWNGNNCGNPTFCEQNDNWLIDGDPSDNYGDNCQFNCPEFGFELSFCPQIAETNIETISFFITDDAQSGGWDTDDGCFFDLNFTVEFVPKLPQEVNSCEGECVELDAGLGCDTYLWSTGETTPLITVCPAVETDYAITATSTNGCTLIDTITVFPEFCCEAEAGEISAADACPGESITATVSDWQMLDIYDQYIIITDENGIILELVDGTSIILESDVCTTFIVHAYNHYIGDDSTVPAVGDDVNLYDCVDNCCELISQDVSFVDDVAPTFDDAPENIEIDCIDNLEDAEDQGWSDNCGLSGIVSVSEELNTATLCDGGTIERTWMTVDSCGNETTHTQTINVLPLAPPEFVDPPANETHPCTYEIIVPDLNWENGLTGNCEDSGSVPGMLSGSHDECGGEYTIYWEYTDECDQLVEYTQTITIEPAPEAVFLNVPADISYACEDVPSSFGDLSYSNNLTGMCEIMGMIEVQTTGTYDLCGGSLLNTWEFTDECGRTIIETQIITILPADTPSFLNPPMDITVNCGELPSTSETIQYSNHLTDDCEISDFVQGTLSELDPCTNSVTEEWTAVDVCGNEITHSRTITVDDLGPIEFENVPASISVSCDAVDVNIVDLDFSNNSAGSCLLEGSVSPTESGSYDACGGSIELTWETTDACGTIYSVSQTIMVEEALEAAFVNVPSDVTISCEDIVTPADLSVTNGQTGACAVEDIISPTVSENYNSCGGTIDVTWNFTDECGRSISAMQQITVTEADAPEFSNPPEDITVSCSDVETVSNIIQYTNGATGNCAITGSEVALQTGSYDACGGSLTQSWSYTDPCDRLITEVRTITIEPDALPEFIDPPDDITLNCGQEYIPPTDLSYSNGAQGLCEISDVVSATVTQDGNVYIHTWEFTDPCTDMAIQHVQTVTLSPDLDLTVDPVTINICLGESYDLSLIDVVDNNGQDFNLQYFTGFPSSPATQLLNLSVSPSSDQIYTIRVFNDLGCEEEIPITIIVDEPPFAGIDNEIELCVPGIVNLLEALGDDAYAGGVWEDLDEANVNLDNPEGIVFGSQIPGVYNFSYTVPSGNTCPPDEAIISVNYFELIPLLIDTIFCTGSNATYTVIVQSFGSDIISNFGDVTSQGSGIVTISDIPIDEILNVTYLDPVNLCVGFININPPNCDCPQVPAPTVENVSICESAGEAILTASGEEGVIIHWYENVDDVDPILSGVDMLLITDLSAGIYSYFVETESVEFPGCFSALRVEVLLEVIASPPLELPSDIAICVAVSDLPLALALADYNEEINSNSANDFVYYNSLEGAIAQSGSITTLMLSETDSVYVRVTNIFGCFSILGFEIQINENPVLSIEVADEVCVGDNGSILISQPSNIENFDVFLDGELSVYPTDFKNVPPGNYSVEIVDQVSGCEDSTGISIESGQVLTMESINYICDNNETGLDATDDFYIITFVLSSNIESSIAFNLTIESEIFTNYAYDTEHTIEIPADGNQVNLLFEDSQTVCSIEELSIPLTPCSTNCLLTALTFTQECNDNGTSSDPTDDFIEFELLVSSLNGSSDNTYVVYINNIASYVFDYDVLSTFELPADGSNAFIVVTDSEDEQCSLLFPENELNPCSNDCLLSIVSAELECFDNGTEDTIDDDYYTVTLSIDVINGSTLETVSVSIDNQAGIVYPINNITFDYPADNLPHSVIVQDVDSVLCLDSIEIGPLIPCSSTCILTLELFDQSCDNQGTDFDASDDVITIEWMVTAEEGDPGNLYQVFVDNVLLGTYSYGALSSTTFDQLNGQLVELAFIDNTNDICLSTETIQLDNCSNSCELLPIIDSIICNNNGTNNTGEDDQFYVYIFVEAVNLFGNWKIDGQDNVFVYNETIELGPYLIADGDFQLTIVDEFSTECSSILVVSPPGSCSECLQFIDAGDSIEIDCNNNLANLVGVSSAVGMYIWTGPQGVLSTDSIASSSNLGWHYFEASYLDGCSAIDSVYVYSELEIPIANAGLDTLLTCKVELITLVGSYDSNGDMSSYWEDEDGNVISNDSTVDVTMSGFYTFYVVDELTGCVSSPDVVFVGLDIEEPLAFIYSDPDNVLNCKIDLINLSYDEEDDVVYEWNFNEQTSSSSIFQIDTTGMVVLTAIDTVTGCIAIDTVLIQELEEFPIVSILPFQTLNCNDSEVIINASNSIPVETSIFEWFDIEGNIIESGSLLTVIDSGQYVLVMTDTISGCVNSDTLEVEANFSVPDITVSADFVLDCSTSATTLEATTNANGEFLWTTLDGQFTGPANEGTLDVISAGVYVVEFIDGESFCNIFDTVLVSEEINLLSLDNWSIEDETCFEEENGALLIGDINGGDLPYVITINDIVVSEEALYELVPGSYEVNVIDADGCSKDTTFVISAAQAITISGPENIDIVLGDSGELDITTNIAVNEIDTIIWSPTTFLSCIDCLNNSTITTENITYIVTIIDVNGCEISTEIEVRVEDFPNIYSPNVFTPNGDGLNDNFTIFTNEVMLIQELVVFNRWGEKVFVNENFLSNDASLGWDGTFKGESVNPAVFAFYALVVLPDNAGIEKIVGDVTVVK